MGRGSMAVKVTENATTISDGARPAVLCARGNATYGKARQRALI